MKQPKIPHLWILNLASAALLAGGTVSTARAAKLSTNTLSFSESLAEKVVCTAGSEVNCSLLTGNSFAISGTLLLGGVDTRQFNSATTFDLTLGGLHINHRLGDDPNYAAGKTSAILVSTAEDGKGKRVVLHSVLLKWSATQLTLSIKGKIANATTEGWSSIRAAAHAQDESGACSENISGSVSFGVANRTFPLVAVTGTVATKHVTGKDGSALSPSSVKLKGSGLGLDMPTRPTIQPAQVTLGINTVLTNVTVGNQGGTVTFQSGPLSGVTVMFPPGAVASNQQITVSANSASVVPNVGTFAGRVLNLQANGSSVFDEPVQITIPLDNSGTTIPVPYYIGTNGQLRACQIVSVDRLAGTLTFETFHASLFSWVVAHMTATEGHSAYLPQLDGFQVGNARYSTPYNNDGNCFGMSAWSQWYYTEKGGWLFARYMQDLPVPGYAPIKGQDCIAVRAMDSVARIKQHYDEWPEATRWLTGSERVAVIANIINNTASPTMLWVRDEGHIVLAYDVSVSGPTNDIAIYDCNSPGQILHMYYINGTSNIVYHTPYNISGGRNVFTNILVQGVGSWQLEPFENIYRDAESGFNGSGAAQVGVTSQADLDHVQDRTVTLSGVVTNGQVLVEYLDILNGRTRYRGPVDQQGNFSIPISLHADTNELNFVTWGWNDDVYHQVQVLNTQKTPFHLILDSTQAVILVTLTWDTDNTDIDLYTIDPTGDYSAYYHHVTADGGVLDYDVTGGYGPEHWTLSGANTVRWGQDYNVRVHYYSDHQTCSSCDPPVDVRPTGWTVTVLVYEGTERMQTFSFHGVLSDANSSNHYATDGGSDWDDVCTITPVKEPGQLRLQATAQKTSSGKMLITVPVPSDEECLRLKLQSTNSHP